MRAAALSHDLPAWLLLRSHLWERICRCSSFLPPPPPPHQPPFPDEESQFQLRMRSSAHSGAPLLISLQLRSDPVPITAAEVY